MFEEIKIKIWGTQPIAKVTKKQLNRLIAREFSQNIETVKNKLCKVESDTLNGKNRISAAVIKLSNKELKSLDHYIDIANADCRDVLSQAEYPKCTKLGFKEVNNKEIKNIYMDDWRAYSKWLKD